MPQDSPNLYNTYIDYEHDEDWDINKIADYQAMQQIAGEDFSMRKRKLGEVLRDRTFNVPEYQRLFSWKTKHHRQLWSDLQQFIDAELEVGKSNISDVFFSSMYFAVDKESDTYEIIDGQQRLTSIHILLRTILEKLQEIDADDIDSGDIRKLRSGVITQIERILYKFESVSKGEVPRLSLNKHDDDGEADIGFFEALISGSEKQLSYLCSDEREYIDGRRGDATQISDLINEFGISDRVVDELNPDRSKFSSYIPIYDSNERLLDAYNFYRERVAETVAEQEDSDSSALALINLSNYIQQSYHIGEFIIEDAAPDFRMQIFEILNDRGLELTKIDRIRAAVVNAFFDADDRDEYIRKWEDIVVAFATNDSQIDEYLSVYLSIIDSNIDTVGEASSELTHAFGTRNIESNVRPRLNDLDEARDFLDHAHELVSYYKDITNSELESQDLKLNDYSRRCQEVLVRLNDQQMNQWRPFILALYHHTVTTSSGNEAKFYETLDTVEKLNFRRLLVGEDPNIFQEIFIEAVHRLFLAQKEDVEEDPYERSQQYLISEMQSTTPDLFADRFLDTITQAQSWNPPHAKLLFGKIANQRFRDEGTIVDRRLNMGSIHLEHVFPQSLVHDTDDPVWLTEFFKLDDAEVEIVSEIQRYISLIQQEDTELDEEDRQLRDNIEEFITQRFINDIGNFVLLRDSDNISASNRPLAEKIPQYFNERDDFTSIYPNRYFTSDYGPVDRDRLEELLRQYDAVRNGERDAVDTELVKYFNSMWTYESLQERRVGLLVDILEIVGFDQLSDEFGLKSEPERVREQIRTQTEQEFEKRLSMRSL
ncbi:DUF262 domain-containing protein [Natronomonas amylolytica]|uniref:DUF262 domain-containing protein n=1 Tax=Natronomonas amylolytica TaxID=3108498 RepID=UPI0030081445